MSEQYFCSNAGSIEDSSGTRHVEDPVSCGDASVTADVVVLSAYPAMHVKVQLSVVVPWHVVMVDKTVVDCVLSISMSTHDLAVHVAEPNNPSTPQLVLQLVLVEPRTAEYPGLQL